MTDATIRVTPELLARYDRPGPRYTSYPTAPQFHTGFGPADYRERLALANAAAHDPLSLYFHIPFCEHRCDYCGCHVVITQREDVVRKYLDHLLREIALVAEALPDRRQVRQLHWGGGTPTHLTPDQMRELFAAIAAEFELEAEAEVAAEIDPRVTTREHLEVLRQLGFNRLSYGVQDFTPEVQAAVGRHQSLEQTEQVLAASRELGFDRFNIDLIYGLPRQTLPAFRQSLNEVVRLRPGRIAVYSYAHVPWIRPHQRKIDTNTLPDPRTKLALLAATIEVLCGAGYVQIGMDHFALPDDELVEARRAGTLTRNFMGYAVGAAPDLVAFGISGIGDVAGAFAQNAKKLSSYYEALDGGRLPIERGYVLDADDRIRRHVIQSLMCTGTLDFATLREGFDIDFERYFEHERRELEATIDPSFFDIGAERLSLTAAGRMFVRNICMVFDRYLDGAGSGKPLYSKTV